MSNFKYAFLQQSISILKVLAYVFAGLGVAGALLILFGKTPASGKVASIGVLFMGGIYFLISYLVAEVIRLLLAMQAKLEKLEGTAQPPKRDIR